MCTQRHIEYPKRKKRRRREDKVKMEDRKRAKVNVTANRANLCMKRKRDETTLNERHATISILESS